MPKKRTRVNALVARAYAFVIRQAADDLGATELPHGVPLRNLADSLGLLGGQWRYPFFLAPLSQVRLLAVSQMPQQRFHLVVDAAGELWLITSEWPARGKQPTRSTMTRLASGSALMAFLSLFSGPDQTRITNQVKQAAQPHPGQDATQVA